MVIAMDMDTKSLGSRLREILEVRGVSQNELARRTGIDRARISQIANDRISNLTLDTLKVIAKALEMSVAELLAGIEDSESEIQPKTIKATLFELQSHLDRLDVIEIPIKGVVPAGYPFEEEEQRLDIVTLPKEELKSVSRMDELFALKIQGESLSGDGIHDGDYVIVDPNADFVNDRIYAVRVENRVTAKHLHRENGHVLLLPSNDRYPPMEFEKIEILGRLILVIKRKKL
jgi:repressor LexA